MLIAAEKKYFATQVIGLFDWSFCCCEKLEKTLFHQFDVTSAPQLPTINETGVARLELESWFGYFAPARTPADVLERLRKEMATVVTLPEVTDIFRKAGGKPLALSASETRALVRGDVERWSKLVRELDIKPE